PADPSAPSGGAGGTVPAPKPPQGGGDNAVSGGGDGNSGNGSGNKGSGPREPDFVEQDPSLSGSVSPDDDQAGTFELDRLNVPNFVINNFEIPPFLLPIYQ